MKVPDQITVFIIANDNLFTGSLKNEIVKNPRQLSVSVFKSGDGCLPAMREKPDIVIVDFHTYSMYGNEMHGLDLIGRLQELASDTEIIIFTGESDVEIAKEMLEQGVYGYIVKNQYLFQRFNASFKSCLKVVALKRDLKMRRKRGLFAVIVIVVLLSIAIIIRIFAPVSFIK